MMRYKHSICLFLSALFLAPSAFAEDNTAPSSAPPARAIWFEPSFQHPSWLDLTPSRTPLTQIQIIASGGNYAIMKDNHAQYFAVNSDFSVRQNIVVPPETSRLFILDDNKLLAYDGRQLYMASSPEAAADISAFHPILTLSPHASLIDAAGHTLSYADNDHLVIVDLTSGVIRKVTPADFFNDEKLAEMHPDVVNAPANKKSKSKSKKQIEQTTEQTQIAEIIGIWWRNDGVGVVRVRRLMDTRTLITKDNGASWVKDDLTPETLVHSFGWIWDGTNRVLSQSADNWLCLSGPRVSPLNRFQTARQLTFAPELPDHWTQLESPQSPSTNKTNDNGNGAMESNVEKTSRDTEKIADSNAEIVPELVETARMGVINRIMTVSPVAVNATSPIDDAAPDNDACLPLPIPSDKVIRKRQAVVQKTPWYTPAYTHTGFTMGLYQDASCANHAESCTGADVQTPTAWILPADGNLSPMTLPDDCTPTWLGSEQGLGVLICHTKQSNQLAVYTRTVHSDWTLETQLPSDFDADIQIASADDGTLVLSVPCSPASNGALPLCPIAVRSPKEIGMTAPAPVIDENNDEPTAQLHSEPLWRIETVENAIAYVPVNGGRVLSIEANASDDTNRRLLLRNAQNSELLTATFDPSPYKGIVVTQDGCLSLYDDSVPIDVLYAAEPDSSPDTTQSQDETSAPQTPVSQKKLLSVNGKLAQFNCPQSRNIAEQAPQSMMPQPQPEGDDRFGMRLGAGGFFTVSGVKTWFMRAEALIPIYGGRYEVGLMYRMAGGNTSSAMGHLGMASVRWRYDDFEHFDFAVGAGIGYGSMCGYHKKSSSNSEAVEEDSDSTETTESNSTDNSPYKKCNDLSLRYLISAIATYKLSDQWKIFIGAEMLGGSNWGFDISGGIEVRF